MKRRKFLNIGRNTAAGALFINGLSVKTMAGSQLFRPFFNNPSIAEDRILVLIQLHGGNDGINMLLPVEQYADYFTSRQNIAIPNTGSRSYINVDSTLPLAEQMGLHPDLSAFKALYDQDKMSIINSVGYDDHNQSHFRSRDIWWMGGDNDDYKGSGWMGRYLDHIYPDYPTVYPNAIMPDPIGLEIGSTVALGYHRDNGIPMAPATNDPGGFSDLVNGIGGPALSNIPDDYFGERMTVINDLFDNAGDYAAQLQTRYNTGLNYVTYPGAGELEYPYACPNNVKVNKLAWQLQTVARLINGGSKTKIYLVKHTGFDTHDDQVDSANTTHGKHAALIYHLANAVKAFQDDLEIAGNDNKVLSLTFSEFGRRVASNGSAGTDHGTAAPMLAFGPAVKGGILGSPPDLTDLDSRGNLKITHDYRQVFTTALSDWLGADDAAVTATEFEPYLSQKVDLIEDAYKNNNTVPVDLLSLKVHHDRGENIVEWKTVNEIALDTFRIEKSTTGNHFKLLARKSPNNEQSENTYQVIDTDPAIGYNYYRLISVDLDGSEKVSNIVSVYVKGGVSLRVFPNPVSNHFTVDMQQSSDIGNVSIRLYDAQGSKVYEQMQVISDTTMREQIVIDELISGTYVLQITNATDTLYSGSLIKL